MRQSMEVLISHVFPRQCGPWIPRSMPGAVHTWKSRDYFHGPVYLVFICYYSVSCRPFGAQLQGFERLL